MTEIEPPEDESDTKRESARVFEILTERDPFRLIIRGYALIEQAVDDAINDAFPNGTPKELRRPSVDARLALARALELITDEVSKAIAALADIRHQFAHKGVDEVTEEHAQKMARVIAPFVPEEFDPNGYSHGDLMRVAVGAVWQTTELMVEHALEERAEAEEALNQWRAGELVVADDLLRRLIDDDFGAK